MSSEDVLARAEAMKFADSRTPMALEKPGEISPPRSENPRPPQIRELTPDEMFALDLNATALAEEAIPLEQRIPQPEATPKRKRRTREEIEADKAAKLAERERLKAERAAERERLKAERAQERVNAKLAAKQEKIALAEGGFVELPAVVFRSGEVRHVSDADAWAVCEMYLDDLGTDVENSGYPPGHALYELRTVQLGGEHAAVVFDAADSRQMEIASLALTLAKKLRSHSASVEAVAFAIAGLLPWNAIWAKIHDSVLNAKLNDPKMSGSDADALKELAADLLREYAVSPNAEKAKNELFAAMGCLVKTDLTTPQDKNGWYNVNKNSVVMTRYAGSDVLDLMAVLRVMPPVPVDESVMEREREFQAACAPVTYVGFALDHEHIKKKIAEEEKFKAESLGAVKILSDGRIINPKSSDVIKLLPEIVPGLVLPLKKRKGTGKATPSADKGSLEGLCLQYKNDPLVFHLLKQILAYRHHDTTLGLLLYQLNRLCEEGDHRMRPTVYTIEASTGRTSCRRPNGQQMSRQGGIRACVRAGEMNLILTSGGQWEAVPEGHGGVLTEMRGVSADFAGCEIRVAAALSGDRGLYEAEISPFCWKCETDSVIGGECSCGYKKDDNGNYTGELAAHQGLHWRTAHSAFGKSATKEHRYGSKRGVFTKWFGGSAETAAIQVYCEIAVMQKLFDAFDADAPAFKEWDTWMRNCYRQGSFAWRDYATGENHAVPIDGSNRMIYQAYSGRPIYIANGQHAAGNGAIQGTARELLVDGTLNWRRTRWGLLPMLPVHDELLCMVPLHEAEAAAEALGRAMTTDVLSTPQFPVRIGADVDHPWTSWQDSS